MKRLRLRKIIKKIKDDPTCWSHCIDGHCQVAAGKYDPNSWDKWGCHIGNSFGVISVREDAKRYLNLTAYQSSYLFSVSRTFKQIIKFEKSNGKVPESW